MQISRQSQRAMGGIHLYRIFGWEFTSRVRFKYPASKKVGQ